MKIETVHASTGELVEVFSHLVPQLTSNHLPPGKADLETLIMEGAILLIARDPDDGPIVGTASLAIFQVLTGIRAHLEDVIVDEASRGLGIGKALTLEAMRIAQESGADGISLTSNPERKAANHMYQKLGFLRRKTNTYYYKF